MINSIILSNFQAHSDLTIDFKSGINIIYGNSDAGKSCIRRAIEWTLFNAKIDGVRKSGTKQTSVKITLDNGVEVERIRSASINRYNLRKSKLEDIISFDAVGKSIPQEIKDAIGIEPLQIEDEEFYLNSAPQLALPFLFDKSPTWRMKLFNKLTGNDLLDTLFVQFNKDLLGLNKELKFVVENLPKQVEELDNKEKEIAQLENRYKKAKVIFDKAQELQTRYDKINELVELFSVNAVHQVRAESSLKEIKFPEDITVQQLREKIGLFDQLKTLTVALERIENKEQVTGQLKAIRVPSPEIVEETKAKIDLLAKMTEIEDNLEINQKRQSTLTKDLECGILNVQQQEKNYKILLLEAKVCPMCKQEICNEGTS